MEKLFYWWLAIMVVVGFSYAIYTYDFGDGQAVGDQHYDADCYPANRC